MVVVCPWWSSLCSCPRRSNYLFRLLHLDTVQRGNAILDPQVNTAQHLCRSGGGTSHLFVVLLSRTRCDLLHLQGERAQLEVALDCGKVLLHLCVGVLARDLDIADALQRGQAKELTLSARLQLAGRCALLGGHFAFLFLLLLVINGTVASSTTGLDRSLLGAAHGSGQRHDDRVVVAVQDLVQVRENIIDVVIEGLVLDISHERCVLGCGGQLGALCHQRSVRSFLFRYRSSISSKRITKDLSVSRERGVGVC